MPVPSPFTPSTRLPSPSVRGLGGCGDEPHTAFASLSEGSSGVGKLTELLARAVHIHDNDDEDDDDEEEEDEQVQELIQELAPNQAIGINVRYQLTNSTVLTWATTYVDQTLYIEVPHGCLPDASKDAFVALLEYAEEVLMCQRAIIYFSKERNERDTLIRTFMYMGFFAAQPESPILHVHDANNVYMVYEIR